MPSDVHERDPNANTIMIDDSLVKATYPVPKSSVRGEDLRDPNHVNIMKEALRDHGVGTNDCLAQYVDILMFGAFLTPKWPHHVFSASTSLQAACTTCAASLL